MHFDSDGSQSIKYLHSDYKAFLKLKKARTRGGNLATRKGGHGGLRALDGSVSSREISNLVKCNPSPTGQIYVPGIFVEHSPDIFPEYSEKVPYEIPENTPK